MAVPEYSICPNSAASSASIGASSGLARYAGTATIRASNSSVTAAAPAGNNRQTLPLRSIFSIGEFRRIDSGGSRAAIASTSVLSPVGQRHEHAVPGAAFRLAVGPVLHLVPHGADQAAVLLFHLPEAGKRGLDAQFLHVGRIDRADQRLDQPVERLPAQAGGGRIGPCSRRRRRDAAG